MYTYSMPYSTHLESGQLVELVLSICLNPAHGSQVVRLGSSLRSQLISPLALYLLAELRISFSVYSSNMLDSPNDSILL